MDSPIAASESFYDNSNKEKINVYLFSSFMRRISIWDYSCITREHYLLLANRKKEVLLKKYYFDMKARTCGKILLFFVEDEAE